MLIRRKITLSAALVASLALAVPIVLPACSSDSTSPAASTEDGGIDASATPREGSRDASPSEVERDAGDAKAADAARQVDKTRRFELTLDGDDATTADVEVERDASGRIVISANVEHGPYPPSRRVTAFFLKLGEADLGVLPCSEGRYASAWIHQSNGNNTIIDTNYGECSMEILSNAADGFTSGAVVGVLGGAEQVSFTLTWGRPYPP